MSMKAQEVADREAERLAVLTDLAALRSILEMIDDEYLVDEDAFEALYRLEERWR